MAAKKSHDVPALRIGYLRIELIGTSPLVTHAWEEKAKQDMLDKQMGKARQGKRAVKVPTDQFLGGLYPMPGTVPTLHDEEDKAWAEGRFGFPAVGIKAAAVRAGTDVGLKMTDLRRAFHIDSELVEIISPPPVMREDVVRVGMGTADIRFRPHFEPWRMNVVLKYNKSVINIENLINLYRTAGFGVGLGEWRPEKNGMWGMFEVGGEAEQLEEETI